MMLRAVFVNPDYSGFPHTAPCDAGSIRVSGETYRSPLQVNLHTGEGGKRR